MADSSNDEIIMNIDEAANFLRVRKSNLYRLANEKKVPSHHAVGRVVFIKSELIEWLKSN